MSDDDRESPPGSVAAYRFLILAASGLMLFGLLMMGQRSWENPGPEYRPMLFSCSHLPVP